MDMQPRSAWLSLLLMVWCAAAVAGEPTAPLPAMRYVVLEGGGPDQGPGRDVAANIADLAERFGKMPPGAVHQLAYGVQQLRILSRSTAVVRADVVRALDLAEQHGIPVFLHVDAVYGWGADGETRAEEAPAVKFWQHPEMREWGAFPDGADLPQRIPRPWLPWGPWCSPAPAVPAYGSPAFIAFATTQLDQGVLVPLAERLARWTTSGRSHLFAGINLGWELHLPDFSEPGFRQAVARAGGTVRADYPRSVRGLEMEPDLVGARLGHASLHWRGWNEERLLAAAQQAGTTRDEQFRRLCYDVLHDYHLALAKACHQRGLAAERVFTHIVAIATVGAPNTTRPPIWTAVNPHATPGFTMDNRGAAHFDLVKLKQHLRTANEGRERPFAVVESYVGLGGKPYFDDAVVFRREIDDLFTAGAIVQVLYGGFPIRDGRASPAVLDGLRQWLAEGTTSTTSP